MNNFLIIGTGLTFQEEVAFEVGEAGRHDEESFAQMHEDGDLKDEVRIKVH
jgi:hypothetical protein